MSELFEWTPPSFVPINAWKAFVDNRLHIAKVKKTARWTDLARDRAIEKLKRLHDDGIDIAEVLLTAAEHGWQDVDNAADHVRRHAERNRPLHSKREDGPTSKQGKALWALQEMKHG